MRAATISRRRIRVSVVATGVDINAANNVRPTGTSHALPPTHASAFFAIFRFQDSKGYTQNV